MDNQLFYEPETFEDATVEMFPRTKHGAAGLDAFKN
jgi:hypothetical protein